jgi:ribosomal protein L9
MAAGLLRPLLGSGAASAKNIKETPLHGVPYAITKPGRDNGTRTLVDSGSGHAITITASGVELDRRRLSVADPIRAVGSHEVEVKLHGDVEFRLNLEVVAEG